MATRAVESRELITCVVALTPPTPQGRYQGNKHRHDSIALVLSLTPLGQEVAIVKAAASMAMSAAMSGLSLSSRPAVLPSAVRFGSVGVRPVVERGMLVISTAQNALKRQRLTERKTVYNKHYKELVKSSSRAVLKGYNVMLEDVSTVSTEADLKPVDEKLSTAFSNIDKAVKRGILHTNTGARRKAKLTRVRKLLLAEAGIYKPEGNKTEAATAAP
jgi:small subunit ribosomal protein S20